MKWLTSAAEVEEKEKVKPEYKEVLKKPEEIEYAKEIPIITDVAKALLDKIRQGKDNIEKIETQAKRLMEIELEKKGYRDEQEAVDKNVEELFEYISKIEPHMMKVEDKILAVIDAVKDKKIKYSSGEKLHKLLDKYGEEAEKFLDKSESQLGKKEEIIKELLLIRAPKKIKEEGSLDVESSVLTSIKGFFSDLFSGFKDWTDSLINMEEGLDEILAEA